MPKEYICKGCGELRHCGRRLCKKCHNKQKLELEKKRRARVLPKSKCQICQREITLYSKNQKYCKSCYYAELKKDKFLDAALLGKDIFKKKEPPKVLSHSCQVLKDLLEQNKEFHSNRES